MYRLVLSLLLLLSCAMLAPAQERTVVMQHQLNVDLVAHSRDVDTYADGGAVQLYVRDLTDTDQRELWALKVDANGTLLWNRQIATTDSSLRIVSSRITALPDGGAAVAWSVNETSAWEVEPHGIHAARLTAIGTILWARSGGYGRPEREKLVNDIALLSNYMIGISLWMEGPDGDPIHYLAKLRFNGTIMSLTAIDVPLTTVDDVQLTANELIFIGLVGTTPSIYKADHQGNVIWSNTLNTGLLLHTVSRRPDGGFFVNANIAGEDGIRVVALDSIGDEEWHSDYLPGTNGITESVVQSLPNNMAFVRTYDRSADLFNTSGDRIWSGLNNWWVHTEYLHPIKLYNNGDVLLGQEENYTTISLLRLSN